MSKHCATCTNANTPICNSCSFIENSKGQSTPTQYISNMAEDKLTENAIKREDLKTLILNRIENHLCVPLRWAIEYNKLLEGERNYGKE